MPLARDRLRTLCRYLQWRSSFVHLDQFPHSCVARDASLEYPGHSVSSRIHAYPDRHHLHSLLGQSLPIEEASDKLEVRCKLGA